MAIMYSAEEVYQMGVEIEKNGRAFYLKASEITKDSDIKKLLTDLASWENSHISLFQKLKEDISDPADYEDIFDSDNLMAQYLKSAADSHVFLSDLNIEEIVAQCEGPADILNMALRFEKDSIVLYTSLMELVPEGLGKKTINRLVTEELSHVSFIQKQISVVE